ncbi:MAG: SdiA-regulated domain-containing protein [Labilithrix sp.]|nr:SdiA-regulated domain-containing protein [Labilithrix sp.]
MLRTVLPLLFCCAVGCAGSSDDAAYATDEGALTLTKIAVEDSAALPLEEVSGLGVRTINGKPQYLAVSDSSTTLVTFALGPNGLPKDVAEHKLKRIFGGGESQWEAVAGDASGRVFIMSEAEGTISVLSKGLELDHVITLSIPEDHPLYAAWERDENSRGEGMLLLENGHILVAKEKGPAALVEFAPKGEDAAGYTPELALKNRAFEVPAGEESVFEAVAFWELKTSAARLIGDISDLAVDANGTIILLSDQSRAIARIERELSVDERKIDLKALWELPRKVDKPEGLVIVGGKPFVASDLPRADALSFFALSAL